MSCKNTYYDPCIEAEPYAVRGHIDRCDFDNVKGLVQRDYGEVIAQVTMHPPGREALHTA
jgi:hypothetical protein